MNIFKQLLEGIFAEQHLTTDVQQADHLKGLRPKSRELWNKYRHRETSEARVNYTDFQHPYLLRYFPFYGQLLPRVLADLRSTGVQLPDVATLCPIFFGCGPAPEFVGLLEHLQKMHKKVKEIAPQFVDAQAEDWQPSRDIVIKYVAHPRLHGMQWNISPPITADITSEKLLHSINMSTFHLAVFQNCFNEVSDRPEQVIANVKKVAKSMPIGALIVIIELSKKFPAVDDMLKEIKSWAEQVNTVAVVGNAELKTQCYNCRPLLDTVPKIIRENLFAYFHKDGPRNKLTYANNIEFASLTMRRCAPASK